jgi:hypothetical protein
MSEQQKQFDVPEVLAALEAAVAKRGEDYVYVNGEGLSAGGGEAIACEYTHHAGTDAATPGCIVGQVYFDLTGELVPEHLNAVAISEPDSPRGVFTGSAVRILGVAQNRQDEGSTWGRALAAAKRAASV